MAKDYNGYIKPSKPWKKLFSNAEISTIFLAFENLYVKMYNDLRFESDMQEKRATKEKTDSVNRNTYLSIARVRNIPYPETDIKDDSVGIQPYQIKAILKVVDIDNLENFLEMLMVYKKSLTNISFYEDGFERWDKIIKYIFGSKNKIKKLKAKDISKIMKKSLLPTLDLYTDDQKFKFTTKDQDVLLSTKMEDNTFEIKFNMEALVNSKTCTYDQKSILDFFIFSKIRLLEVSLDKAKEAWEKELGFRTKNVFLLMNIEPKFFNAKVFIKILKAVSGQTDLSNVSDKVAQDAVYIYKAFGKSSEFILDYLTQSYSEEKVFPKILSTYKLEASISFPKFSKMIGKDYDVQYMAAVCFALSYTKTLDSLFFKMNNVDKNDLSSLNNIGLALSRSLDLVHLFKEKHTAKQIFKGFKSGRVSLYELEEAFKLVKDTKNIKQDKYLKDIKGEIDGVEYEVVSKSDIRGPLAGSYTDCCQNLNSFGRTCVLYAAYAEDSSYLLLSKEGVVFAQSFIWKDKRSNIAVFDSIEYRGKNEDILKIMKKVYLKVAKDMISNGVDSVNVGSNSIFKNKATSTADIPSTDLLLDHFDQDELLCEEDDDDYKDEVYSDAFTQYNVA